VLGNGEEIKFEIASGAGAEFLRAIEHLDAEMARSCLTQFLVLGQGGNSSVWNLSRDQSDFFLMCPEAELRDLEEAITNYLIAPLVRMNFGEGQVWVEKITVGSRAAS
jgi:phage gp29-like protein